MLSSDDILLADPSLGRCWGCFHIFPLVELTEAPMDVPDNWQYLCDACLDKENRR